MDKPTLAVVGATGAIGRVVLDLLSLHTDLWADIRLAASPDESGGEINLLGREVTVTPLTAEFFNGVDISIFDLPVGMSKVWAPIAVSHGSIVIDNGGDHREDPDVPVVAPGVNLEAIENCPKGIIAIPGATVMTFISELAVLHERFGLVDVVLTSLQSASGRGRAGLSRLHDEISLVAQDANLGSLPGDVRRLIESELGASPFPAPLAMNVIPWIGRDTGEGETTEEVKVRDDIRKVLGIHDLRVDATCVRVPVARGHSVSLHARFRRPVVVSRARRALLDAFDVVVLDDPDHHEFPTPSDVVGSDPSFVGRIRQPADQPKTLDLFVCGDNLRSGAAVVLVELARVLAGATPSRSIITSGSASE